MTETETTKEALVVLKETRELLSDPSRWTQGAFARDKAGNVVYTSSPVAHSFCAHGAILHIIETKHSGTVELRDKVWSTLGKLLGPNRSLISYNDGYVVNGAGAPTGYDDVIQLFDAGISVLEAEVSHG